MDEDGDAVIQSAKPHQGPKREHERLTTLANTTKTKTWACLSCQTRKIKCDGAKPFCSTCIAHDRECHYDPRGPKQRARVPGSRRDRMCREKSEQRSRPDKENQISHFVSSSICNSPVSASDSHASLPVTVQHDTTTEVYLGAGTSAHTQSFLQPTESSYSQTRVDVRAHLSRDKSGDIEVRGPTNTLYEATEAVYNEQEVPDRYASAILTANAAMERQKEAGYRETCLLRGEIEGVPAELALHLLDIHWSRHHFFQLSYRPAFYRDMMCGGPYYSKLLFYSLLAVSSRYSERDEVGGGDHSHESGHEFYQKAKELLIDEMERSSIPTATALLLMGNALVSAGQIDRGWLYTGMGVRMIINLGLHLDVNQVVSAKKKRSLEDIEIGRRVFWGAFVSEKLQSLYLGRPIFIHDRDVHVPKTFLDVYEEGEIWTPFPHQGPFKTMESNSISSFQAHCTLSEICGDIMSTFYAVKAKTRPNSQLQETRDAIRHRLSSWIEDLPDKLRFTPWKSESHDLVPIHVIVLHTIYYSLVILLERPFVADGHLNTLTKSIGSAWVDCTIAAEKIGHLLRSYRGAYTFRRIPYQLCYATYVASTILVRNANNSGRPKSITHLAICLKGFEEMKIAHQGTARMEALIRSLMTRLSVNVDDHYFRTPVDEQAVKGNYLPSPNFENSAGVMGNTALDLDSVRQSFAPGGNGYVEMGYQHGVHADIQGTDASVGYQVPEMTDLVGAEGMGAVDINWDLYGNGMDHDLLFGVLAENWL